MDRSFLSLNHVVQVSRRFVCIRTLTYEDAEERDFQRTLYLNRSGDVDNTVFCILSPDAKQRLTRSDRGVAQVFQSADHMAQWMKEAADYYEAERKKARKPIAVPSALPLAASVRLGLNTAAADSQPLVVLHGGSKAETARLEAAIAALAWNPEFLGRCAYASTSEPADLAAIHGDGPKTGLLVVEPQGFGLTGKVLARAEPSAPPAQLAETLRKGLAAFQPPDQKGLDYMRRAHVAGVFWETRLPVTDTQEAQARQRSRRPGPSRP